MRADCLHQADAEMPAATALMEATLSSRGAPSGAEPVSQPKALLRGVAPLVAAVEELEARTRLPFVPHGAASVLLVRLFSLDPGFLACVRELDDAREAAGLDSRDPRWALDTAEALWALDRLLRHPEIDAREILGAFGAPRLGGHGSCGGSPAPRQGRRQGAPASAAAPAFPRCRGASSG